MTLRLDGKQLAATLQDELRAEVAAWNAAGQPVPCLATVLVGADPASQVYVRNKRRTIEALGMLSQHYDLPAEVSQSELLSLIARLNADPAVHGILVQLPLPKQIDENAVLLAVDPSKDVDAFHPDNVGRLMAGKPRFIPCTPHGVQLLLVRNGIETDGAHVVILGRSNIVGKPLAALLVQKGPGANATVTIAHSRTRNLAEIARSADILIAAIGSPEFVTPAMVRPGATVIDVGTNRRADGKLVGDVAYEAVFPIASAITPVPGGVGPMTIAMLMRNTFRAAQLAGGD